MPQSSFFEKDRAAIDTVDTTCPKTLTVEDEEDERCPTESWKTLSYEDHATATATIKSTLWITEFEFTTIQVTDSERIPWTTRPDELHASTATPMGTPVVTHFVTSRSTVSEDTMKLSSEVIQCLLAVVFVGSMLWLATFWRGKSAFRTLCVLSPTFAPSVLIYWLRPQLHTLDLGWASSNVLLTTIAATSFLAASLLVLDVTGVTTLLYELFDVLRRWRHADGWKFGWGWTSDARAGARREFTSTHPAATCPTGRDPLPGIPRCGSYL
ncbi:predicted protein [Plenodomus lingam JN3]|uniref:Predicted protein n=1 Tax=Leptosphaeria maculans (strain JN3 / isolate v23.1.3 / race Av1-4-5-6-7-8) TaxID=985895 RepID=E4ZT86_LEPMJ|nr:predicted protein [Plenodomus lingam JN3]CBX90028.1 predicted protein [Plenodomus lingam JN3]